MGKQRKNKQDIKNTIKTNKAITLIALVVTIVVLLILAGVSLNLVIRRQWYYSNKCKCQRKNI